MRKRIYQIIEHGKRSDKASVAYDVVMLIAIVASIVPLMFVEDCKAFHYIEQITVALFILDYFLRWMTADFRLGKKTLVFDLPLHFLGHHRPSFHLARPQPPLPRLQDLPCHPLVAAAAGAALVQVFPLYRQDKSVGQGD